MANSGLGFMQQVSIHQNRRLEIAAIASPVALGALVGILTAITTFISLAVAVSTTVAMAVALAVLISLPHLRTILRAESLLQALAILVAVVAVLTVAFNGLRVANFADLSDSLLALALILFGIDAVGRRVNPLAQLPRTIWVAGGLILLSAFAALARGATIGNDIPPALELVLAQVGVCLTLVLAATGGRSFIALCAAWMLSATADASVALTDSLHLTSIGQAAVGFEYFGRENALSFHPNHLGLVCAMAFPATIAVAVSARSRLLSILALSAATVLFYGVLVSGSRAALVAAIVTVAGLAFVTIRWRRRILAYGMVCGASIYIAASILLGISGSTTFTALDRLLGFQSVGTSDIGRAEYLDSAMASIAGNPFVGTGFSVIRFAHDIYVQLLQSGGIVALGAFLLFLAQVCIPAIRHCLLMVDRRNTILIFGVGAGLVAWLVVGTVQNILIDRFVFLPAGLLLAAPLALPLNTTASGVE